MVKQCLLCKTKISSYSNSKVCSPCYFKSLEIEGKKEETLDPIEIIVPVSKPIPIPKRRKTRDSHDGSWEIMNIDPAPLQE